MNIQLPALPSRLMPFQQVLGLLLIAPFLAFGGLGYAADPRGTSATSRPPPLADDQQAAIDRALERKTSAVRDLNAARDRLQELRTRRKSAAVAAGGRRSEEPSREVATAEESVRRAEATVAEAEAALTDLYRSLRSLVAGGRAVGPLDVGDVLEVFIKEDETLNGSYPVRIGGYIMMPRVGRVFVAGLDLPGAEKAIRQALEADQVRNATVVVDRRQGTLTEDGPVIFLAGEFARPGILRLPPGSVPTLVTVMLQCGGITDFGDPSRVWMLRLVEGREIKEEVNLDRILTQGRGLSTDVALLPGDILVVPPRPVLIQVTGSVVEPGSVKFLPGEPLTAYLAVLRSGGFNRFASRRRVYVLRELGGGRKERIDINFKEVQKAQTPDVVLIPGDIVVVPERWFSF